MDQPGECEFAIVMADHRRGQGIGSELMHALMSTAKAQRMQYLLGWVLSDNQPMLSMMKHLGFKIAPYVEDPAYQLLSDAYIVAYRDRMTPEQRRRWSSWDDYMREWCRRRDFKQRLPQLLRGEDAEFSDYILKLAEEETHDTAPA